MKALQNHSVKKKKKSQDWFEDFYTKTNPVIEAKNKAYVTHILKISQKTQNGLKRLKKGRNTKNNKVLY